MAQLSDSKIGSFNLIIYCAESFSYIEDIKYNLDVKIILGTYPVHTSFPWSNFGREIKLLCMNMEFIQL